MWDELKTLVSSSRSNEVLVSAKQRLHLLAPDVRPLWQLLSSTGQLLERTHSVPTLCFAAALFLLCAVLLWRSAHLLHHYCWREVRVTCWFCHAVCRVPRGNRNCWDCPRCEQYNGFAPDGGYNKPVPAQRHEHMNHTVGAVRRPTSAPPPPPAVLCERCTGQQALKVAQLAQFEPMVEARFDQELAEFRARLERSLALCARCEARVERRLRRTDLRVLPQYRAWWRRHQQRALGVSGVEPAASGRRWAAAALLGLRALLLCALAVRRPAVDAFTAGCCLLGGALALISGGGRWPRRLLLSVLWALLAGGGGCWAVGAGALIALDVCVALVVWARPDSGTAASGAARWTDDGTASGTTVGNKDGADERVDSSADSSGQLQVETAPSVATSRPSVSPRSALSASVAPRRSLLAPARFHALQSNPWMDASARRPALFTRVGATPPATLSMNGVFGALAPDALPPVHRRAPSGSILGSASQCAASNSSGHPVEATPAPIAPTEARRVADDRGLLVPCVVGVSLGLNAALLLSWLLWPHLQSYVHVRLAQ